MATTHEERLRELAYHGLLADPHGHATAACLAGAEALRLLREYQEAFKAFDAVASLLSAPPAAPAPADLVATCEWSEDANGELGENAPEFLAPQPADGVTQAQHEIVASIIDMVEHDQSRRAEMNRLRADALRAVLARALASPAPPATNEHEQAAQQILVTLAPLVSDAAIVGRTYGWPEVLAVVNAAAKKLASPAPQPAESDGSVMVRIDRVYVDAMRGDGLTGPFACVRLVEYEGEPRLELTTAPVPTPDTAEWWREVAQGLGVEIAKLKALVSAPACVASTPQGDVCGLCGRASADHRGPENAAAPAPVEPPPADMATVYGKRFDAIKSADERLEAMRGKMPDAEIDVYKAVLAADARRKAQE